VTAGKIRLVGGKGIGSAVCDITDCGAVILRGLIQKEAGKASQLRMLGGCRSTNVACSLV